MTAQETKTSLAQSLVLSKLNFNDTVTYSLPAFLQKKVQRVQNAAVSFSLNRFFSEKDVLDVGWLPTLECTQNILKLVPKALHKDTWPSSLALIRHNPGRELRSSRATTLQIPLIKGTRQNLQTCFMDFLRLCDLVQISQPSEKKLIESCKQGQANGSLNINTLAIVF